MKLPALMLSFLLVSPSFANLHEHDLTPEAKEEKKPVEPRRMWTAGTLSALGFVGQPAGGVLLGYLPVTDFLLGAGLGLNVPVGGGVNTYVIAGASYMFIDRLPFSMGPEFVFTGQVSSSTGASAFSWMQFQPGLAFWYAPFPAPLGVGGVFQGTITVDNGQTSFRLDLPTLRIAYVFN